MLQTGPRFRLRYCLNNVLIGFGIGELVELLDLQDSRFVGNDMYDVDRLASRIYPERVLHLVGRLWVNK